MKEQKGERVHCFWSMDEQRVGLLVFVSFLIFGLQLGWLAVLGAAGFDPLHCNFKCVLLLSSSSAHLSRTYTSSTSVFLLLSFFV